MPLNECWFAPLNPFFYQSNHGSLSLPFVSHSGVSFVSPINIHSFLQFNQCSYYLSDKYDSDDAIDLLLIQNEVNNHYVLIKDFDGFRVGTCANKGKKVNRCKHCLSYEHRDKDKLLEHKERCSMTDPVRIDCPSPDTFISFKKHCAKLPIPFIMIYDF